jgi:hypothetical protein
MVIINSDIYVYIALSMKLLSIEGGCFTDVSTMTKLCYTFCDRFHVTYFYGNPESSWTLLS